MPNTGRSSDSVAGEVMSRLLFEMCGVSGFGQSSYGEFDGRRIRRRHEPRSAQTHFLHLDSFSRAQRLRDTPNTGSAVHAVNAQCELPHCSPRSI